MCNNFSKGIDYKEIICDYENRIYIDNKKKKKLLIEKSIVFAINKFISLTMRK